MDGRVSTGGGRDLGHNPFSALDASGLLPGAPSRGNPGPGPTAPAKNRGRVDITREKGGRGGKTVTVVDGFTGIGLPEKELLMRQMRAGCGCGGTVKDGRIEIQGDQRETVAKVLVQAGFRPVFAGG